MGWPKLWVQSPQRKQPPAREVSLHAYSYIQQIGRSAKSMNPKNTKKSPIDENADANITNDLADGDISRSRSCQSNTRLHVTFVSWILLRFDIFI